LYAKNAQDSGMSRFYRRERARPSLSRRAKGPDHGEEVRFPASRVVVLVLLRAHLTPPSTPRSVHGNRSRNSEPRGMSHNNSEQKDSQFTAEEGTVQKTGRAVAGKPAYKVRQAHEITASRRAAAAERAAEVMCAQR
jgi:hypothetical protein